MASQVGRNDPCPCSSGKKYKKCCLAKEEARRGQPPQAPEKLTSRTAPSGDRSGAEAPAIALPAEARRALSPSEQRWERFWEDFEQAPRDERLNRAREVVETEPELDGEWVFELCEKIVPELQREGRLAEADAFLDLICTRHPGAAAEEAHWIAYLRTQNALLRPAGDVRGALLAWVPHARRNVEFFEAMLERLRFHDRIDEVLAATASAWPLFRDDPELINPQGWFLTPAVKLVIDRAVESQPGLSPEDPSLWAALMPFLADLDPDRVKEEIRMRAAPSPRGWQASAFAESGPKVEKDLFLLSLDFRDALHRHFGWTFLRAELGREELTRALLDAEPERPAPRGRSPGKPRTALKRPLLLPSPAPIEQYLLRLVSIFSSKPHRAAALAMALFPWLAFLMDRGLIEPAQAHSLAAELRKRLEPLPRLLDSQVCDPILQRDLAEALRAAWPRSAGALQEETVAL